jgi:hypothetical protein
VRTIIEPTLQRNTILDVSAEFGKSFVVINDGKGHKEPIIVRQEHRSQHPDLSQKSFPLAEPSVPKGADSPDVAKEREERHKRLDSFITERRAEESGSN